MSGRLAREWFADLKEIVRLDEPLAPHTSFGIGGPAACFAAPRTVSELERLLDISERESLPWRVLGGGTNVLVRDEGFNGIVIHLDREGFGQLQRREDSVLCGAAVPLPKLARAGCRDWGDPMFAALAGIPGTVGGAARMNAGTKHGSIGSLVKSVRVVAPDREVRTLGATELSFGYRTSSLAQSIVLELALTVVGNGREEAVSQYESLRSGKRHAQPWAERSAGCVFINPTNEAGATESAGRLIDSAGLKNRKVGGARVSDVHANFIVSDGSATAADVLALIEIIQRVVKAVHGVELSLEIEIW